MLVVKLGNVTRVGASNFSFNNKDVRVFRNGGRPLLTGGVACGANQAAAQLQCSNEETCSQMVHTNTPTKRNLVCFKAWKSNKR